MSTLTFPFTPSAGSLADVTQVNSDFAAVATVVNGNLESSTNVKVATPVAQTSASLGAGSSNSLARADHAHVIQCTEQLASDPGSGNFVGRRYFNTATLKERLCIATGGAGTWVTMGNYSSADLPAHASNHGPAGSDALAPPTCIASRTSALTISTATVSSVPFNATDIIDATGMHDPVTNNTRITFAQTGTYWCYANINWVTNATGVRQAGIFPNANTNISVAFDTESSVVSGQNPSNNPGGLYRATAGDFIELWVYQNSGGNLNIQGDGTTDTNTLARGCRMGAYWVGSA